MGTFSGQARLQKGNEDPNPLQEGDELLLGELKIRVMSIETADSEITEVTMPPIGHGLDLNSTYECLDELEVLAQQARLADVISQCYPEVDHGPLLPSSNAKDTTKHETTTKNMTKDTHDRHTLETHSTQKESIGYLSGSSASKHNISKDTSKDTHTPQNTPKDTHSPQSQGLYQPVENTTSSSKGSNASSMSDGPEDGTALLDSLIKVLLVETQRQLAVDRIENPNHYETMSKHNIFRQVASLPEFYGLMGSVASVRQDMQEVLRYLVEGSGKGE